MQANLIKPTLSLFVAAGIALAATGAQADWSRIGADPYAPGDALKRSQVLAQEIDARQDWQRSRIEAGVQRGSLTHREARALMLQQHEIRAMQRRFLADGHLDRREVRHLHAALDDAGRAIRAEKHDQQARFYRDYHPRYN